jgi:hypothetical protein
VSSPKKRPSRKPPFELRKTRVQLEKLEERLLLSAEPLLQVSKSLQGQPLTVDNVQLDTPQGDPVDASKDPLVEANLQAAQVIDLSRGIDQNTQPAFMGGPGQRVDEAQPGHGQPGPGHGRRRWGGPCHPGRPGTDPRHR